MGFITGFLHHPDPKGSPLNFASNISRYQVWVCFTTCHSTTHLGTVHILEDFYFLLNFLLNLIVNLFNPFQVNVSFLYSQKLLLVFVAFILLAFIETPPLFFCDDFEHIQAFSYEQRFFFSSAPVLLSFFMN